jgi:hypothetical protein
MYEIEAELPPPGRGAAQVSNTAISPTKAKINANISTVPVENVIGWFSEPPLFFFLAIFVLFDIFYFIVLMPKYKLTDYNVKFTMWITKRG